MLLECWLLECLSICQFLLSDENKRLFDTWAFRDYESVHTFALKIFNNKKCKIVICIMRPLKGRFQKWNFQIYKEFSGLWPVEVDFMHETSMKWTTKRKHYLDPLGIFQIWQLWQSKWHFYRLGYSVNGEYFVTICKRVQLRYLLNNRQLINSIIKFKW